MSTSRSNSAEVRNPLLGLPSAQRLQQLPPEVRELLRDILMEIRVDANVKAEASWRKSKGPIACYWRAVSTYALHLARVLRPRCQRPAGAMRERVRVDSGGVVQRPQAARTPAEALP